MVLTRADDEAPPVPMTASFQVAVAELREHTGGPWRAAVQDVCRLRPEEVEVALPAADTSRAGYHEPVAPTLSCDMRRHADAVVIVARGELDMNTSATLESAVNQALRPIPTRLVLDCSQLTFCDSTGMSLLVRLWFHAEEVGSRLVIDQPSRQLRRLFTVTGLDTMLDLQPDHDTAAHQASD